MYEYINTLTFRLNTCYNNYFIDRSAFLNNGHKICTSLNHDRKECRRLSMPQQLILLYLHYSKAWTVPYA